MIQSISRVTYGSELQVQNEQINFAQLTRKNDIWRLRVGRFLTRILFIKRILAAEIPNSYDKASLVLTTLKQY